MKKEIANSRNMGRPQSWSIGVQTQSGEMRKVKAQLQKKLIWGTKAKKVSGALNGRPSLQRHFCQEGQNLQQSSRISVRVFSRKT